MKNLPCVEKHRSDLEQNTNRLRQVFQIISSCVCMHYKTVFSEIYKFSKLFGLLFQKLATGCQARAIGLQQLAANSVSTPSISILAITILSRQFASISKNNTTTLQKKNSNNNNTTTQSNRKSDLTSEICSTKIKSGRQQQKQPPN